MPRVIDCSIPGVKIPLYELIFLNSSCLIKVTAKGIMRQKPKNE